MSMSLGFLSEILVRIILFLYYYINTISVDHLFRGVTRLYLKINIHGVTRLCLKINIQGVTTGCLKINIQGVTTAYLKINISGVPT